MVIFLSISLQPLVKHTFLTILYLYSFISIAFLL